MKYQLLPHLNDGIDFKKPEDDNPFSCLDTIDMESKYLNRKKMKLFTSPLRTTTDVLIKMNIKDYVISSKPDGIFSALYIDSKGIGYYLYPLTKQLFKIGKMKNSSYFNVICNGELMEKNHYGNNIHPYLLLFDILEWKNNIVPNDLFKRVDICKDIIKYFEIYKETNFISNVSIKSYVPIKSIHRIISSKKPKKDGLIFTPKYGKPGENCIRWKPFPTLTVGLEYDKLECDFRIFFKDINHKKQFRKRYYDLTTRHYSVSKSNGSFLFKGEKIILKRQFDKIYLKENPKWDKKTYPTELLIELFVDKDPFFPSENGHYIIKRCRYDKRYPDHINEVNDILNLIHNPVNLSDILGKKSMYKYWIPPSKKYGDWVKYSKNVKKKLYSRWVQNNGSVLDMCSGRGSDANLLFSLSKKKNIKDIYCLEKDEMQLNALKDFTMVIRKNNIIGMDCNIKINQFDMNDPILPEYYQKKFDTIICSNAIQFAMDPTETCNGISNIKRLLKNKGVVILIFMNAEKLPPQSNRKCECYLTCENGRSDFIINASESMTYSLNTEVYNYVESENCFDPLESYENNTGLYYKYDNSELRKDNLYYDNTHVWVQIPTSLNAVREPLVYSDNLIFQFRNMGFELIEKGDFNRIKKNNTSNLSDIYTYVILRNSFSQKLIPSILGMIDDNFFELLSFLDVTDIFSLGMVHRIFTDNCLKYMKLKQFEWQRLYQEINDNQCYNDISEDWS